MEHITINSDRSVTVPVELRKIGVQYDHNVNTIEFVGPRYSGNVDLSTMTIYINYILSDKTPGKYKAENVIIDDQDDSLIRFNWTITRNVTKAFGILSCLVCAKKTDEEGNEINHWNTDIFRLLSVSEGMENDPVIQEQYPDVITSLIQNVEEHDTKLLEFSGLNNRVTDLENNIGELKGEIDNIHIPEQVQPDWNQNDDTAADYIKNKPFYDNSWVLDTSNVLETNDINSDVGFVLVSNNPDDFLSDAPGIIFYGKYYNNTEYKLTISHYTMYDCEAFLYTDDDGNKTTICYVVRQENTSIKIYNAGTRYEISNPSIGIWVKHDPQSSKMASIYTKDVHKIDEKYLPDIGELKSDLADKVPKKDYAPETKTESMTQPVGKDENGKLWTTPDSVCAVSSVNSKTGAVVLTADDVHAMRDDTVIPTVPDKGSAFKNDAGYLTAHQDISGKLDADKLPEAVNDALAQAAASGEFDGTDGKSAYQYAKDGGYTGTEAEFAEKLAQEQLTGTTDELTPTQVYNAVSAGIPVKVQYIDSTYGLLSFTAFNVAESLNVIVSQTIVYYDGLYVLSELIGNKFVNTWETMFTDLAQKIDIPSALPNPNSLIFTGAVTGSYNGSTRVSVEIPSVVTDDHINELINTALNAIGVAEEGVY